MSSDDETTRSKAPLAVPVSSGLAHPSAAAGSATVFAAAASALGSVPVPLVDGWLTGVARGSSLRRIAKRHGVLLTRAAREELAKVSVIKNTQTAAGKLVRSALTRLISPLRLAGRAEEAFTTFASAMLLDHYLATHDRPSGAPLGITEAERLRQAIEMALARGGFEALRSTPISVLETVVEAARAGVRADDEDRGVVERVVDTVLDRAADAPSEAMRRLSVELDIALRELTR